MKTNVWKSDSEDARWCVESPELNTNVSLSCYTSRVKTGFHVSFKLQHMNISEVKNITLQWHLSKGVMCSITQHLNS